MKFSIHILFFFLTLQVVFCQPLHPAIDSTDVGLSKKINFVRSYFRADTTQKNFWHPKYAATERYNFSTLIDGISRNKSPKEIAKRFQVKINELQVLNDTLSYFKFALSDGDDHFVSYKLYLVEIDGQLYLDNCKDYEQHRFNFYHTPNISFYVSPWFNVEAEAFQKASQKMDSLYTFLQPEKEKPHVENYLCASVEEMNILTNMTLSYGYVGGFTAMEHNFIVAHNDDPLYLHEFVHVLLGKPAGRKNLILGEGVASYLGGISSSTGYAFGLNYLKECFESKRCSFDLLWQRKIYNPRDNIPTYAFAAAICEFIITEFGFDYFKQLYYDPTVTDDRLILQIEKDQKVSKKEIIDYVFQLINYRP